MSPLQNLRTSKLATNGFAPKSDTHHKTRGIRWMPLVLAGGGKVLPSICACRKCVGSHSPPEDLQARLQGVGRVNLRQRRIPGDTFKGASIGCPLFWLGWQGFAEHLRLPQMRRFAFTARRSASSLARRRACESSPKANTRRYSFQSFLHD